MVGTKGRVETIYECIIRDGDGREEGGEGRGGGGEEERGASR